MTYQRSRKSIKKAIRRAHVVGALFPSPAQPKPALGTTGVGMHETVARPHAAVVDVSHEPLDLGVIEGPDGVDPEIGPYVDRKLSIREIQNLIGKGVDMRLLPDGMVRIPVLV